MNIYKILHNFVNLIHNTVHNRVSYIIITLAVLCSVITGRSNDALFKVINRSNGLEDLHTTAIFADNKGYIWFGTMSGIERFDGINTRYFPLFDAADAALRVNAIAQTADDAIWIATNSGIRYKASNSGQFEQAYRQQIYEPTTSLITYRDTVFVGAESGLYKICSGKVSALKLDNDLYKRSVKVNAMAVGRDSLSIWLATAKGLAKYSVKTGSIQNIAVNQSIEYTAIANLDDKLYLASATHGLSVYDITNHQFSHNIDADSQMISAISTNGRDLVYIGTDGNGVRVFNAHTQQVVGAFKSSDKSVLSSDAVYSLYCQPQNGRLWIGYFDTGAAYRLMDNAIYQQYHCGDFQLDGSVARTVAGDSKHLAVGTRTGVWYIDTNGNSARKFGKEQMKTASILSSVKLEDGSYIFGTNGAGAYRFNPSTSSMMPFDDNAPEAFKCSQVLSISANRQGEIWFATSSGVYVYDSKMVLRHLTSENSLLPKGIVYCVYFDSLGRGWIGTDNGLVAISAEGMPISADIFSKDFVHNVKVRCITETSDGHLLFVHDKNRLYMSDRDMKHFGYVDYGHPLGNHDIYEISEDSFGNIWIPTTDGLFRLQKEATDSYSLINVIPSHIFFSVNQIDNSAEGYICSDLGLLTVNLDKLSHAALGSHRIVISGVKVNGNFLEEEFNDGELIRLSHNEKNLCIFISDFDLDNNKDARFEWCIDDGDWTATNAEGGIVLPGLSSGKHTFKVRLINNPDTETTLVIKVGYNMVSVFFQILAIILILVLSFKLYARYRQSSRKATDAANKKKPGATTHKATNDTEKAPAPESSQEKKYRNINLTEEEGDEIVRVMQAMMEEQQLYTNPELKVQDLAEHIGVNSAVLSYVFSQRLNTNFSTYVNTYRVNAFKRLMRDDTEKRFTLSAMASQCGFASRTSFFRIFKQITGISPNEYLKSIQ
jgi:ligand-binding sensor domain-containing protein/AraC-like DNA-binding protein